MADDITMQRLDQRIEWYDHHSAYNQWAYKVLKLIVIVAAALIPFLSGTEGFRPPWLVGALGVVIAVAEGIQQLNQHHVNWTSYRSTCEALKHERHLYLAKAAPYGGAIDAHALLASASRRSCPRKPPNGHHCRKGWTRSRATPVVPTKMADASAFVGRHPQRLSMRGKDDLPDPKLRYKSTRTSYKHVPDIGP